MWNALSFPNVDPMDGDTDYQYKELYSEQQSFRRTSYDDY